MSFSLSHRLRLRSLALKAKLLLQVAFVNCLILLSEDGVLWSYI